MSDQTDVKSPDGVAPVAIAIRAKLRAALSPITLEVIDESRKHAGHAHVVNRPGGAAAGGETHFKVKVVAASFEGKSRIERHRAVNLILAGELAAGVHALSIEAKAPGE